MRAFERLHPADGFEFRIASEIPLSGGLGSSAAAIVAGLLAADHLFELDADVLALASRARGPSGQRRRGAGRRLRRLRGRARAPVRAADGARGGAGRARRGGHDRASARGAAGRVPLADAVFNVAHASTLMLGLATARLGPDRRGAARPPAPAPPRAPVPALGRAARARAAARCARRDDLRRRPDRARVVPLRADRRWSRALERETAGWAEVLRAPFESQGADVREL